MEPWESIGQWCTANAPATAEAISPPIAQEERWAAERRSGGWPWPPDVVGFFEWCNGTDRTPAGYLLPDLRPLHLAEVVTTWQMFLSITFPAPDLPEPQNDESVAMKYYQYANDCLTAHPLGNEPAGSTIGAFFPSWLPVAEDQSGSYLMVDRRKRGKHAGSVFLYDKVNADIDAPRWRSLSHLADATHRALMTGEVVEGTTLRPTTASGRLHWQ